MESQYVFCVSSTGKRLFCLNIQYPVKFGVYAQFQLIGAICFGETGNKKPRLSDNSRFRDIVQADLVISENLLFLCRRTVVHNELGGSCFSGTRRTENVFLWLFSPPPWQDALEMLWNTFWRLLYPSSHQPLLIPCYASQRNVGRISGVSFASCLNQQIFILVIADLENRSSIPQVSLTGIAYKVCPMAYKIPFQVWLIFFLPLP